MWLVKKRRFKDNGQIEFVFILPVFFEIQIKCLNRFRYI